MRAVKVRAGLLVFSVFFAQFCCERAQHQGWGEPRLLHKRTEQGQGQADLSLLLGPAPGLDKLLLLLL